MKEPVNTKTYEQSFPMAGMETRDIMLMVESVLCELRHQATEDFAKRLRNYGHFNGDLTSNVYHSEDHVRCEVVANDYGLPLRVDEHEAGRLKIELREILRHMDELAELWGDEGNFRRLRERLRELAEQPCRDS